MKFRVPKFLERETVVAFGLTFKRLTVFGALALVLFFLYYVLPKVIFATIALLSGLIFITFTFIKIEGQPLYALVAKSFGFLFSPRTYIWRKKEGIAPIEVIEKKKEKKKEKKEAPLKVAPKSRLGALRSKIDLGSSPR